MQVPRSETSEQNQENGYKGHSNGYRVQTDQKHEKPLQIVGLAKKAGLLAIGSDDVLTSARAGKAKLIIFASDTSEGTVKRARYEAERLGILDISTPFTKFEFSRIAGRGSPGMLALLDLGLAEAFMKRLSDFDMTRYGEVARLLETKVMLQKANKAGKPNRVAKASRTDRANRVGKASRTDKADRPDKRRVKV